MRCQRNIEFGETGTMGQVDGFKRARISGIRPGDRDGEVVMRENQTSLERSAVEPAVSQAGAGRGDIRRPFRGAGLSHTVEP